MRCIYEILYATISLYCSTAHIKGSKKVTYGQCIQVIILQEYVENKGHTLLFFLVFGVSNQSTGPIICKPPPNTDSLGLNRVRVYVYLIFKYTHIDYTIFHLSLGSGAP